MPPTWIWQQPDWPRFRWDQARLASALSQARLSQGKVLGAARLLDADLTREAMASILVEDGLTTSAIEGERLDPASLRSSVARRLGLPTAALPVPPRAVDGLIDVLLDATQQHGLPLTRERLCVLHAVNVFGAMPIWRPAVGWVSRAQPSFQALTVLPMLGFVPQPSLRGVLAQSLERGNEYGRNDDEGPRRHGPPAGPSTSSRLVVQWRCRSEAIAIS